MKTLSNAAMMYGVIRVLDYFYPPELGPGMLEFGIVCIALSFVLSYLDRVV